MKFMLIALVALNSLSAFAESKLATPAEKKFLCSAASEAKPVAKSDVLMKDCVAQVMISDDDSGTKILVGRVPFNSCDGSFTLTCEIAYEGTLSNGKPTGGHSAVSCR